MFDVYNACVCVRVCENIFYHLKSSNKINTPVTTTQIKKRDIRYPEAPTHIPASPAGSFSGGCGVEGRGLQ